jgi:prolyl oligopeptidase
MSQTHPDPSSTPPKTPTSGWKTCRANARPGLGARAQRRDRAALRPSPASSRARSASARCSTRASRSPTCSAAATWLYNLWRDAANPRGLWRRTTLAEYRKPAAGLGDRARPRRAGPRPRARTGSGPAPPAWGPEYRRCLVQLSRGGADATVVREFDTRDKRFVEGGFVLPEAKTSVEWLDADTVYVGTDFGPGSLTDSGYPRVIKRWRRGQPLAEAVTVFEGRPRTWRPMSVDRTPGFERTTSAAPSTSTRPSVPAAGRPPGAGGQAGRRATGFWRDHVLLELRSDWAVAAAPGRAAALLVADAAAYLRGARRFTALFTPTPRARWRLDRHARHRAAERAGQRGQPARGVAPDRRRLARRDVQAPYPGTLSVARCTTRCCPTTRWPRPTCSTYSRLPDSPTRCCWAAPAATSASAEVAPGLLRRRRHARRAALRHAEGRHARALLRDLAPGRAGRRPQPHAAVRLRRLRGVADALVLGSIGRAWTGQGGVYVVANIRGGGEFGPAGTRRPSRPNKQKQLRRLRRRGRGPDRHAASRARAPGHPGRQQRRPAGRRGDAAAAGAVQRRGLPGAAAGHAPLPPLLAGASWMAEYGDPDEPERLGLHLALQPLPEREAGQKLPPVLFTTSTRDDRVHPGHARKMAARMREQGHRVLYWENIEGGHGGAADNAQRARMMALEYGFLWQQLAPRAESRARRRANACCTGSTTTRRCRPPRRAGPGQRGAGPAGRRRHGDDGAAGGGLPQGRLPLVQPGPAGAVVEPRPAHGAAGGRVPALALAAQDAAPLPRTPGCEVRFDSAFRAVIAACAARRATARTAPGSCRRWSRPTRLAPRRARAQRRDLDRRRTGRRPLLRGHRPHVLRRIDVRAPHRRRKIALAALVAACRARGVALIDCQQNTGHLASLGAREIPRALRAPPGPGLVGADRRRRLDL